MIIRRKHNGNYCIIGNQPMNDTRLAAEALGILCYLRSRPDNWNVVPEQLAKRFDCGRDRVRRIIGELVEAGYILRSRTRDGESKSFSGTEYLVYDEPQDAISSEPRPENTSMGEPQPENPSPGKPGPANPPLLSTDTEIIPEREQSRKDDWPEEYLLIFWKSYPPGRKIGKRAVDLKLCVLRKSGVPFATIMGGVDRYVKSAPDPQFTKSPLVWLNQGCWDDEFHLPLSGAPRGTQPSFFSEAKGGQNGKH